MEVSMRKMTALVVALTAATGFAASVGLISSASAQDASAQAAYRDIEQTLGSVPTFFKLFPEVGIAGAWAEFKAVQLNPNTKLDGKTKELIGLAVSAQIPCHYCVYFHTAAAKLNGATDQEIREAVAMAAISRHWSTVLNGMQVDTAAFKAEIDTVLRLAGEKAKSASK
jgi:AhpD family alkylhydroperoxidase